MLGCHLCIFVRNIKFWAFCTSYLKVDLWFLISNILVILIIGVYC